MFQRAACASRVALVLVRLRAWAVAAALLALVHAPASAAAGDAQPSVTGRYLINTGDQLAVQVFGEEKLSQMVTVLPSGDIYYPLAGRVHVAGLTPDDAAASLKAALSRYLRHPVVSVSVALQGLINVLVLGNVKAPGKYALVASAHVTDALAAAGGLGPVNGEYPVARVADSSGNVQQVDLQKLLHGGDTSGDLKLRDETTVYVPAPNTFNVEVFGSVKTPGDITLNEGDRLAMAIAKAGADPSLSPDLNHVQVKRVSPDGQVVMLKVDLYKVLQSGDLSKDFPMQKGDVVFVPQAKKSFVYQIVNGVPLFVVLKALLGL